MRAQILLLACLTSSVGQLNAQAPDWNWAQSINGPGLEYIEGLATDQQGNVYATGAFNSPSITLGSFTLLNSSSPDTYGEMFVAKFAPDGAVLWAVDTDGPHGEGGNAIAVDQQGNVYVLGGFGGTNFTYAGSTFSSQGVSDLLLVKYDPSGVPLWARKAGSTGQDSPAALTIDPSGNVIIGGEWNGASFTLGSYNFTNAGGMDQIVAKYNSAGDLLWAKSFGSTITDYCLGLVTDMEGNIYSAGRFDSPTLSIDGITLTCNGGNDLFLAKFDATGTAVWAISAGGSGWDQALGLVYDGAGGLIVSGSFQSDALTLGTTTLTNASAGDQDMYLARFTTDGDLEWATSLGITGDDREGLQIGLDDDGNIYVPCGFEAQTINVGASTLTNVDGYDTFVAKFDSNGVPIWAAQVGGAGYEVPRGLAADAAGNVFVSGYYQGGFDLTIGTTDLPVSASYDSFMARSGDLNVGVTEIASNTTVLSNWNSGTGELWVYATPSAPIHCAVYTMQGSRVAEKWLERSTSQVLQDLPSGAYLVVCNSAEQRQVLKLIRE